MFASKWRWASESIRSGANSVLKDGEIEHQYRYSDPYPPRQQDVVEQAPATLLSQRRDADSGYRNYEAKHQSVEDHETEIARPTDPP